MFCWPRRRKQLCRGQQKETPSTSQKREVKGVDASRSSLLDFAPRRHEQTGVTKPEPSDKLANLTSPPIATDAFITPPSIVTVHFRNLPENLHWQRDKEVQTLRVDGASVFNENIWGRLLLNVVPQTEVKVLETLGFYPYSKVPGKDFSPHTSDRSNALSSFIRVSDRSNFDASAGDGLTIADDESLAAWLQSYISTHLLRSGTFGSRRYSSSKLDGDVIKTNSGFILTFHRTLRVPDNGKVYPLPADLGNFSLVPVADFASRVPASMLKRGGYLMPIYQCEAMWMSFSRVCPQTKDFAVKISIGGINAISGKPQDLDGGLHAPSQDYISHGPQPWLDGVRHGDGTVRQFVAAPLRSGQTVEEQYSSETELGGIQIDVFPSLNVAGSFWSTERILEKIWETPKELGVKEGEYLRLMPSFEELRPIETLSDYKLRVGSEIWVDCHPYMTVYVRTLTSKFLTIRICSMETILDLKLKIRGAYGVPLNQQRLIFAGKHLEEQRTLSEYNIQNGSIINLVLRLRGGGRAQEPTMGFGVGGQIKQNIYEDRNNPSVYDQASYDRLWIHTVSPSQWKSITGLDPPPCPVTQTVYEEENIPWFDIYDDIPTLAPPYPDVQLIKPVSMPDDWNEERQAIEEIAVKNGDVITYHLTEDRVGALKKWTSKAEAEASDPWRFQLP